MSAPREDVEFESCGATLRGWLYRSEVASGPAVVMAHGLSAVKEMFLDDYAEAFVGVGLTVLAYDHFGIGASEGEPRQSPSPDLHLQGYRDAVAWVASQPFVDADRIGLWGSSLSGGEVIMLAVEALPIACAVAQVPNLGEGAPVLSAGSLAVFTDAVESGRADAMIPAVAATADGAGVMFVDDAYGWFTRVSAERAPAWRNEVLVSGLMEVAARQPIADLPNARVPLLLVVAPGDTLTPPGPANAVAAATPNVRVVEIPGNHFAAYEGDGFTASSTAAIDWFRTHLAP